MWITPAFAQGAAGNPAGEILPNILLFGAIFAIFYFLLIRPQQKRMRDHQEMVAALRRGDTVVTAGGLIGKVTKVTDDEVQTEIAEGVKIRVVRNTIAEVRSKNEPVKDDS